MNSSKKYFEKRTETILALLKKTPSTFSPGSFHKLRVEIKKMRALADLIGDCNHKFNKKKLKPFKNIYHQAGKVRELQLEEATLKKYGDKQLKNYMLGLKYSKKNERKIFFTLTERKLIRRLEKEGDATLSYIKDISNKRANKWLEKKLKKIEQLSGQKTFKVEDIHELRKRLKTYIYVMKSMNEKMPVKKSDALQDSLGKWHDCRVMGSHLLKAIHADTIGTKEKLRLLVIRKKIAENERALFKRIKTEGKNFSL